MRLLVVAGHGAGDPGAVGYGQEAERVRALANRMKDLGGASVVLGDPSANWYAQNLFATVDASTFDAAVELHLDSGPATARGGHVITKAGGNAYDAALASFVGGYFPGRSSTIVARSDLQNVNVCAGRGIDYRLLEVCFVSNADDMAKFDANLDEIARGILGAFGIAKPTKTRKKAKMQFIYRIEGRNGYIYYDGSSHHEVATPAELETIKAIYKEWAKEDIPDYLFQPNTAKHFLDLTTGPAPTNIGTLRG